MNPLSETINAVASTSQDPYQFDVRAEDIASKRGQVVVFPETNQLQLDLDSQEALSEASRRFACFSFPSNVTWVAKPSLTKDHYHVTITFPDKVFDEWERLALQAALNSDPFREYLNVRRKVYGVVNPTRLFETP